MQNQEVRDAFGLWLATFPWAYFLTVTFREPRHPYHAISTLRQIGKTIKRATDGDYFLGTEVHVSRTLHVHGLLSAPHGPSESVPRELWRTLFKEYGRSQVHRVRSREAVSTYVSKYVTKEMTEWDMS